jgi:hypothetical protein
MKRRTFIRNAAALAATPALPAKVFAGTSGVSAAIYAKAVHYAKLWDTSVPEMYTSALGLDETQAHSVFNRLVTDNIIGRPNGVGMGQAVLPYYKDPAMAQKIANILRKPGSPPITKPSLKADQKDKLIEKVTEVVKSDDTPQDEAIEITEEDQEENS